MFGRLEEFYEELDKGYGHKGSAEEILKKAGLQNPKDVSGAHLLSELLRFDALRQTPVDGMHRELLGMIKLHFQCIWATLEKPKRTELAKRIHE